MPNVLVTGATGTIGRALVPRLLDAGHHVLALSRDAERARSLLGEGVEAYEWRQPTTERPPSEALSNAEAIVHLLGETVAQRWSADTKTSIRESRVMSARQLVDGVRELPADARPHTLVCQSATGYYGARGEEPLDEDAPPGDDFLAQVVVEWEREASAAESLLRVVKTRTGVVLSSSGGALATMLPVFRLGLGGPVAGGGQYIPWVHLDDVIGPILRCLDDEDMHGPFNLTAPAPVTNREFTKALGRVVGRPAIFPVPALALRALYGEMAQVILSGARALPTRLERAGYQFLRPELEPALQDILARRS